MYRAIAFGLLSSFTFLLLSCAEPSPQSRRFEFSDGKNGLVRVDTGTGEVVVADSEGVKHLLPPRLTESLADVAPDDLRNVTGYGKCNEDAQTFESRIYNGTGFVLRSLDIKITHKSFLADRVVWDREFVIRDLFIRPHEVGRVVAPVNGLESSNCAWTVSAASGTKWHASEAPASWFRAP